ncbi:hypothetical protein BZA77DRAFT_78707 [Pyronema omphalodes]|nr:hypothetical protein BZA77DRAFT_78707 [Pyronema omphalodes]
MGWFRTSKKDKERKEAMKTLKHFDKKKANKMSTNADPSKAITELQPFQVNQEKPRQGLSDFTHKDIYGREIREPDLSNPTRNRWERPLDTIRAFQDAIDRGHYRESYYGGEGPQVPGSQQNGVRRSYARSDETTPTPEHIRYGRAMPNRMGDSTTPLSYNSVEEQMASFGVYHGRNYLNEAMVATAPVPSPGNPRYNYHSGGGYDTGYSESSRGNSSGTLDPPDWNDGQAGNNYWGGQAYPINYGNGNGNGYQNYGNGMNRPPAQPWINGRANGSGSYSNGEYNNNYLQVQPRGSPGTRTPGTPGSTRTPGSTEQPQPPKRNIIKLTDSTTAAPVPPTTVQELAKEPYRRSWLGKKVRNA